MIFCYDHRVNEFEIGAESHWTIAKLSSLLSCYVDFDDISMVVSDVVCRVELFPLVRSREVALESFIDAKSLFFYDRLLVLKVLVEILKVFDAASPYYLLNSLYVRPFVYFIQVVSNEEYKDFLKHVSQFKVESFSQN